MKKVETVDEGLKAYATERQREMIDAVNRAGSFAAAAAELGIAGGTISSIVGRLKSRAARLGYAPGHFTAGVPEGYLAGKVTIQRNHEGTVERTWERVSPDQVAWQDNIKAFIEDLTEGCRGRSPDIPAPSASLDDLLCVYPMGDPHFGMYAWKDEAGEDFDLDLAESLTKGAVRTLVNAAPAASTAVLLNLGDFFHMDNSSNQTARSHNALDVDTRWAKVMQVGLRTMVYAITELLTKHWTVIVRNVAGNHDTHSSFALALALDAFFSNNPRVEIDLSPAPHWFFEFGKVLIGSTHGDTTKPRDLLGVMATDQSAAWGRTIFRYWYCGHIHHDKVEEMSGVTAEWFRTLAARDAWHSGQGYRAGRDMRCIVHHREYGEVARNRCDVAMLTPEPIL